MESELIFIFFLALILLGPRKLPELSRKLGKIMAEFRRAKSEFTAQIESEVRRLEEEGNKLLPAETGNVIQPPTAAPAGTVTTAGQITAEPTEVTAEPKVNGSGVSQETHA
jgi:Sec-independent protein translocase protein TatA